MRFVWAAVFYCVIALVHIGFAVKAGLLLRESGDLRGRLVVMRRDPHLAPARAELDKGLTRLDSLDESGWWVVKKSLIFSILSWAGAWLSLWRAERTTI